MKGLGYDRLSGEILTCPSAPIRSCCDVGENGSAVGVTLGKEKEKARGEKRGTPRVLLRCLLKKEKKRGIVIRGRGRKTLRGAEKESARLAATCEKVDYGWTALWFVEKN